MIKELEIDRIQQVSLSEQLEEKLRSVIREMALKPGDSLPGELELAKRFGVSRNVVREALVRLKAFGVLESRKNRGIILKEPDWVSNMSVILDLPLWNDEAWRELSELRVQLELGMSEFIYRRKTPEHLEMLDAIVREEEENPASKKVALDCDFEFHAALYKITRNQTVMRFQTLLRKSLSDPRAFKFFSDRFENPERINHRVILESLKNDSLDGFIQTIHRHFSGVIDHLDRL